jgi:tetratricopeptide (TPR) repeat protein
MYTRQLLAVGLLLPMAACGPRIHKVMSQGEIVPQHSESVVAQARAEGDLERARLAADLDRATAEALATCSPHTCAAISRGEIALGMSEAQVLAATRTTRDAWEARGSGRSMVMTSRVDGRGPSDAVGELAMVQIRDGGVSSYTYRESQGLRTVATVHDATTAGQAAARAEALLREGDGYAAAGDLQRALDRYDRADVIRPGHPETTLRIAQALDKQLRPLEALMRYQLFLHQMELEKIAAHGDAYARMAEAIALAQQRIVVLDRRR